MSKASRRRQPPGTRPATGTTPAPGATPASPCLASSSSSSATPSSASSTPLGTGTTSRTSGQSNRSSQGPGGSSRTGRRPTARTYRHQQRPFVERYRGWIVVIAALAGVALIALFVFTSAAAPAYACSNLFDPAPTASPSPGQTPNWGYPQDDMGNKHVVPGSKVTFTYCPPASGNHYNSPPQGPIVPRVYGPNDKTIPQGWVHNLEHGALVLLYRGDSAGATPEGQQQLKDFFAVFPPSPICNIPPGTIAGPVFTRFDSMKTPFAALVWDRVLPLQDLDRVAILAFYQQWGEQLNPSSCLPAASADPEPEPGGERQPVGESVRQPVGESVGQPEREREPERGGVRQPELTGRRRAGPGQDRRGTGARPAARSRSRPSGINDVLIRVHKTGICGTDLHIESWDAWAAKTIQPPLIVGHEFVGEIVEVGSNVVRLPRRRPGQRRGPRRVRPLPALPRRPTAPVRQHHRPRRRSGRVLRRVRRPADDQHLAPLVRHRRGDRRDLRPVRQRGPHGARLPGPRRGRADLRRRPDRADGDRRRPPRRRAPRRGQRAERLPARPRDAHGRHGRRRPARARAARRLRASSTWSRGSTSRSRCPATPPALRTRDRGDGPRRRRSPSSASRPSEITLDVNEIVFKIADPARHLRPRDVRDLVQDDRHAPVRARHHDRPSPTASASATSRRPSRPPARATPARSSWTGPT